MRALLYIVMLLIVTGCGYSGTQSDELDAAQKLMAGNPAEALSRLNGMDVSEFQDSATMARWALLYSEALAENRLSAPTDTIVNIAIDYYGRHDNADGLRKALHFKSVIMPSDNSDALATALYLQKEKEYMLYKERAKRERYLFWGIVILLVAAGTIVWMRQKINLQNARNNALMAEASGLKCQIDATRSDVGRLESKLHNLLENRFALIDSLCQTYYEMQGTKNERKAIADKVKSEIDAVRTDSFPELEQAVNDCRDNILVRVKDNYPQIKADDYQLLVYLFSGLSTRTMSLLLGESVDVVYKRKSRLKSRLKESVGQICPDVMDVF